MNGPDIRVVRFGEGDIDMTNVKILSAVQSFVLEGYKKHAGTEGLTCDDLGKLLRPEDPDGLLGPVEKRRCNHASTQLKKLGLIERSRTIGDGPTKTGMYRAKTAEEIAAAEEAKAEAEAKAKAKAAVARVIPFPGAKSGVILRKGELSVECPLDATPELIAELVDWLRALP